jgi:cytochrome c biogenesis protein CcmG, thiol:disulfide interchange protein DsbE
VRAYIVVLLLLIACARRPDPDSDIGSYHAMSLDGHEVSLRDVRGQVVLLNVWTLWCLPCRHELPTLERLHRTYRSAGLTLVGVNVDARGDLPTIRKFVRSNDLTYAIWLDPEKAVTAYLPTLSLPATWLIGRDGRIVWTHRGIIRAEDPELDATLRSALAESPSVAWQTSS